MKVGESEIVPQPSRPSAPPAKAEVATPVADTATSGIAASVVAAREVVAADRVARVQELASQVKSGGYQPNPQQIAAQILDEAEIDAQLEARG